MDYRTKKLYQLIPSSQVWRRQAFRFLALKPETILKPPKLASDVSETSRRHCLCHSVPRGWGLANELPGLGELPAAPKFQGQDSGGLEDREGNRKEPVALGALAFELLHLLVVASQAKGPRIPTMDYGSASRGDLDPCSVRVNAAGTLIRSSYATVVLNAGNAIAGRFVCNRCDGHGQHLREIAKFRVPACWRNWHLTPRFFRVQVVPEHFGLYFMFQATLQPASTCMTAFCVSL